MRLRALLGAAFALAFVMNSSGLAATRYRLVYRVDNVSAAIEGRKLVVRANGAVSSGGWRRPRLLLKPSRPEASILHMDLVADPPPANRVVVQELLPVHAQVTTALPKYGTVAVSVASQTNEVTAQIRP